MRALAPKYTGRLWPNGEFGVSRVREAPISSLCPLHNHVAIDEFNQLGIRAHGVEAVLKFRNKWKEVVNPGLSIRVISHISTKRGSKGITSYGRKMVRNCAAWFERRYSKRLLSFGTVTLPSVAREHLEQLALNWSEIIRRFAQNLKRNLRAKGLPAKFVGVTEIQEERMQKEQFPVPHFHFVFVGRCSEKVSWQLDREIVRKLWILAIKNYVPESTDFCAVENVTGIKKSAAGYLGKYMSKGSQLLRKFNQNVLVKFLPSAWWSAEKNLKIEVWSKIRSGEKVGELLRFYCENEFPGLILRKHEVIIESKTGVRYGVGWSGIISPDLYLQINSL